MAIPWIQIYSNLLHHPKTTRLADELRLTSSVVNPNCVAVGMLVSLWTWAVQHAYDGDLSGCSARAIADACTWKRKPDTLLNALVKTGWIDPGMRLHDWEEYAVLLMDAEDNKRQKTRQRVQRYRDKKKADDVTPCNADVTVTGNAPVTRGDALQSHDVTQNDTLPLRDVTPLPYQTIPDHTKPNHTSSYQPLPPPMQEKEEGKIKIAPACAREAVAAADENENTPFGRVMTFFMDKVQARPPEVVIEGLQHYADVLDAEVIIHGLNLALAENITRWSFINGILGRYERDGLTSMDKVLDEEQRHRSATGNARDRRRRENTPPPPKPRDDSRSLKDLENIRQRISGDG